MFWQVTILILMESILSPADQLMRGELTKMSSRVTFDAAPLKISKYIIFQKARKGDILLQTSKYLVTEELA